MYTFICIRLKREAKGSFVLITIKNLSKTYNDGNKTFNAISNINLEIPDGEIFGIIGLSGAGKTSLMRLISVLEPVTKGNIYIDGVDLTKLKGKELRDTRKISAEVFKGIEGKNAPRQTHE